MEISGGGGKSNAVRSVEERGALPKRGDCGKRSFLKARCAAGEREAMGEERMGKPEFSYEEAFSRNIGWVTPREQERLRGARVAIAGMGGVGGSHLMTLARLGVGAFSVADFDRFDLANMNRQAGASMSSLGMPKAELMAQKARDVNPEIDARVFSEGIAEGNVGAFLEGADVYVDGIDFFAFKARRLAFRACAERGIPAITVAPLGMGAALMNFLPGKMGFEEYFRFADGDDDLELGLKFLMGMAPSGLQMDYLLDPSRIDLEGHKGPSTIMACQLCSGIAATEALKIILRRGEVAAAPRGIHFDAFKNELQKTWRPWGNANPLQRISIAMARSELRKARRERG